jgi:hypothetical protein
LQECHAEVSQPNEACDGRVTRLLILRVVAGHFALEESKHLHVRKERKKERKRKERKTRKKELKRKETENTN